MMHVILQPSSYAPASTFNVKPVNFFITSNFNDSTLIFICLPCMSSENSERVGGRKVTSGYTMLFAHMNLPTREVFPMHKFSQQTLRKVMENPSMDLTVFSCFLCDFMRIN